MFLKKSKYFIVQEEYTKNYYVKQRLWPLGSKFTIDWVKPGYQKKIYNTLVSAQQGIKRLEYYDKLNKPSYIEINDG